MTRYTTTKNGQRLAVEPGERNDLACDPQLTYESDLREEELARLLYRADPEELAEILEGHMPAAVAALIANLDRHVGLHGYPALIPLLDAVDAEVARLLREHVERETKRNHP